MSKKNDEALLLEGAKRWSIDCKATVKIGDFSRGGRTRGDNQANAHDMGCKEKYTPCGIVDEDSGELYINFGSSYKTSDFIVDTIESKWRAMDEQDKMELRRLRREERQKRRGSSLVKRSKSLDLEDRSTHEKTEFRRSKLSRSRSKHEGKESSSNLSTPAESHFRDESNKVGSRRSTSR